LVQISLLSIHRVLEKQVNKRRFDRCHRFTMVLAGAMFDLMIHLHLQVSEEVFEGISQISEYVDMQYSAETTPICLYIIVLSVLWLLAISATIRTIASIFYRKTLLQDKYEHPRIEHKFLVEKAQETQQKLYMRKGVHLYKPHNFTVASCPSNERWDDLCSLNKRGAVKCRMDGRMMVRVMIHLARGADKNPWRTSRMVCRRSGCW
ncbi:hypothetical protein KCU83_g426, partial [Aureobasidium melanogenum]